MTDQELYNRVRTHLLTQRARSMNGNRCVYRGSDGLRCAIGCLIPDEQYSPALESWSAHMKDVKAAAGITDAQEELAAALQHIHDDYERTPVDEWESRLNHVAERFGLTPCAN